MTGLNGLVPYYDYALDMVLDVEMPMEDSLTEVSACKRDFHLDWACFIAHILWIHSSFMF